MAHPVCSNERHLIFVFEQIERGVGAGAKRDNQAIPIVTVEALRSCGFGSVALVGLPALYL